MYRRKLTEAQVADALEAMEITASQIVGSATVTTGESPRYGAAVLIQTASDFSLVYEIAQGDEPDLEPTPEELAEHMRNVRAWIARGMAEGEAAAAC